MGKKYRRKSVANELVDEPPTPDTEAKAANADEQVEKRMQRLNLYFEKENVSHYSALWLKWCRWNSFDHISLFIYVGFGQKVDADEVKSRQEYLRTQRDKIVALKRKVRTEQLNVNAEKTGRPSSAQAAQRLLLNDTKLGDTQMEASLQLRKTLAKRLRNEVVDSKE